MLQEFTSANSPMQEPRRSSGVLTECAVLTPERYRTIDAAITGRYTIPCLSKAQIKRDNLQA
jgi:hypothetical protein